MHDRVHASRLEGRNSSTRRATLDGSQTRTVSSGVLRSAASLRASRATRTSLSRRARMPLRQDPHRRRGTGSFWLQRHFGLSDFVGAGEPASRAPSAGCGRGSSATPPDDVRAGCRSSRANSPNVSRALRVHDLGPEHLRDPGVGLYPDRPARRGAQLAADRHVELGPQAAVGANHPGPGRLHLLDACSGVTPSWSGSFPSRNRRSC